MSTTAIKIGFTMSLTGARSARTTRLHYWLERVDPFGSISREVDAALLVDDKEEHEHEH